MSDDSPATPAERLEDFFALRVLRTHLPHGARVLELGGDAGRATDALARDGHTVTRLDVPADPGAEPAENDASFDAVLALGSFSSFARSEDRDGALREATRVLRPGGFLFATFAPRLAGVANLLPRLVERPEELAHGALVRAFMHGTVRGKGERWLPYVDEAERLFTSTGLALLELRSLRGLAYRREAQLWPLHDADPGRFAQLVEILEATAGAREVLETCGRALFVGRKPAG